MLARALASWNRLVRWRRVKHVGEEDRRVWVRFPSGLDTALRPGGGPDGPRLGARVQDVSRGGIQLLVDRPFEPGELVSVDGEVGVRIVARTSMESAASPAQGTGRNETIGV